MKRPHLYVILILLMGLGLGFFDLPYSLQQKALPQSESDTEVTTEEEKSALASLHDNLAEQYIHLGLDLQGGTQLDYKIDLQKVDESDRETVINGVLEVITRRVNGLGVSEPNIYRSQIADEEHIIVELAGVSDLEKAKETVGKTIQLEFKETNDQPVTEEELAAMETAAQDALDRVMAGEDFELVAQEVSLADPISVNYFAASKDGYRFETELPDEFVNVLQTAEIGGIVEEIIFGNDGYTLDASGNLIELEGYYLLRLLDRREGEKPFHEDKEVETSHILISYAGALSSTEDITRTKEEALAFAEEIQTRAVAGEDFAALAAEYSDDTLSGAEGGELGFITPGEMVKPFEDTAFGMEIGDISEPVESEYGYHIITVTDIKEEVNTTVPETEYRFDRVYFSTLGNPWKDTELTGEHFVHADVEFNQNYVPLVSIEFDDEGADLFEELTTRNVGKPIAIFVGGDLISAPNVNEPISGGQAQISGDFTIEEASDLARDLNTGAIPAPVLLVGQYTIGASLGQDALDSSIRAGLIGLIILMVYMVLYYRLPGLLADIALLIYAGLVLFVIKVAMPLALALTLAVIIFAVLTSIILKSRDSGWEKLLAFLLACFILFFFSYLLANPVVLTLAGVAGVILSIGMAIDANILIFERIREELRNKRPLASAIEVGFDRAWSSIRDSNFSSLITCAILIYFGTSMIKGFAVNLALGILLSMFTAITVTKTFLKMLVGTKLGENAFLMGIPKKGHPTFDFVGKRKIWFTFSAILIGISLIVLPIHGLKLDLDFTGGTLMELKFETPVSTDALGAGLQEIETALQDNEGAEGAAETELDLDTASSSEDAPVISEVILSPVPEEETGAVEFGEPVIVESGENTLLVRMKHISNETHDALILALEEKFGPLEETRYTAIGATVGETLKQKAVLAIAMAMIMIIFYIAFAFRQIPRELSAWRFGVAAIVALLHDVFIPLGIFSILGATMDVEIDALFITGMLTVMGFSVHDTIVTFDRIRENLRHQKSSESFATVANRAINETLARSINTSFSTLITVSALFFLGADSIKYFLLILIVGIIVGTYSSVMIATPLLVWWKERADRR